MASKPETGERLIASNKKAYHDYFIVQKFEAGIVLTGTEMKSLRAGKANLKDAYVLLKGDEAYLFGAHISPYTHGNLQNHDPERTRKLLLHRKELSKLYSETAEKGLTVVPLRLYFKGSKVKAEIAVVRGKKQYDKRDTERTRELDREAAQAMKERGR
jgi:SsrA-binding protein